MRQAGFGMWPKPSPGSGGVLTLCALGPHPLTGSPLSPPGSHDGKQLEFDPGQALYKRQVADLTILEQP